MLLRNFVLDQWIMQMVSNQQINKLTNQQINIPYMKHNVKTAWKGNMQFESEVNGHKLLIDGPLEAGGGDKGPRPKQLMLTALAGCTGIDVVAMLKKMRVEIDTFDVDVEAEITEEPPTHYTRMHVIYTFTGKDLPMDKLQKAVDLSREKYCGVSYMYKKAGIEVTYEIKVDM
jgi:putative redox protein